VLSFIKIVHNVELLCSLDMFSQLYSQSER